MDFFLQLLVNGLSIGLLYGLSAMGFVMIFKSSSVLNFAHGELLAIGAFIFLVLTSWAVLCWVFWWNASSCARSSESISYS